MKKIVILALVGLSVHMAAMSLQEKSLFRAIEREDVVLVRKLIAFDTVNINVIDYFENFMRSPLYAGVIKGNVDLVRLLIDKGSDVNFTNHKGETLLHILSYTSYDESIKVQLAKLLILAGADVDKENLYGSLTPLVVADKNKNYELGKLLVLFGASLRDYSGEYLNSDMTEDIKKMMIRLFKSSSLTDEQKEKYQDTADVRQSFIDRYDQSQRERAIVVEQATEIPNVLVQIVADYNFAPLTPQRFHDFMSNNGNLLK